MSKRVKSLSVVAIIAMLILLLSPVQKVKAEERKTYDISKGNVVITKSGNYNLVGSTDQYNLTIASGVKVNLWMKNVTMNTGWNEDSNIILEDKSVLNIIVSGTNLIVNDGWYNGNIEIEHGVDAIELYGNAKLQISKYSTGSLEVRAEGSGSGIGGSGSLYVMGGTIKAYGGMFGAGIGNSIKPAAFKAYFNGGMTYAYGGVGQSVSDSWVSGYFQTDFSKVQVSDISASKIQITGGMVMAADTLVTPVNKAGKTLSSQIFNCNTGKIKSISIDKIAYGSAGIVSNGYLCLWSTNAFGPQIVLTYADNSKQTIEGAYRGVVSEQNVSDTIFDIGKSSIEILGKACIYNNCIYKLDDYYCDTIQIKGTTKENHINVQGDITLIFDSVNASITNPNVPFLTVGNGQNVTLTLKGSNTFSAKSSALGTETAMLVGHNANLSITASSVNDSMDFNLAGTACGIHVEKGSLTQCSGTISAVTNDTSCGLLIGNGATYTLTDGTLEGTSEAGRAIYVLANGTVKVCNGSINAINIGFQDEANEEITDDSTFIITGGKVNVTNRMIFGNFYIYGGEVNAHLMGSGSNSVLYQYGGDIIMDRFVTDYLIHDEFDVRPYEYNYQTGEMKGSAIEEKRIFGGTLKENQNVPGEELLKISYGRC